MTGGPGRILISYAPDDAVHVDAVREFWILLRARGLDARLHNASGDLPPADLASAAAVVLIGSALYREVGAADDPGEVDPGLWHAIHAVRNIVDGDKESGTAVLPVLFPGGTDDDLPDFLPGSAGPLFRVRAMNERGIAALVDKLRQRCGTMKPTPRHELRVTVTVEGSRLRSTTMLADTVLCVRDEFLPFGRDEVWTLLDLPNAEARMARLGQRLSAALFDADSLDQLTTLVTTADEGTVIDVLVTADGPAHELPFEMIRLTDQQVLATAGGVRFARSVVGVPAPTNPATAGPLKILVAVGAPTRTESPALDIEAEMQAIVSVVGDLGRVEVTILDVAGPDEIADALRRDPYHVLHLSAHGSAYGVELEDREGNAVEVRAEDLVRVLRGGGRPLPLIVLSSCGGAADADTGLATTLLRHGADRVIAMQTTVTDTYATRLLTRVYRALAEENLSVAAALAVARSELFGEAVDAGTPNRPEYAVPTLFAASDGPLLDAAAQPVPLSNPTELPTGVGVRELLLGELVGRRAELRVVTGILRDEAVPAGQPALVNGVVLTGAAGIGKTALAGRAVNRLRDDLDDPWSIVVQSGSWNPPELIAGVAAATAGTTVLDPDDEAAALTSITETLRTERLLLVFDDFEQNLTVGGEAFLDPGFAEVFGDLCQAAERGKVLVTSRYPLPGEVPLARVEVPPLSDAELRRLLLRLPALRELAPSDRESVVQAVGGHPRLVEFADALLGGSAGKGRLPEVTERLRRLAEQERVDLNRWGASTPGAAEAARRAIALGTRDMLLDELLKLLSPAEHEALLQAAVLRVPVADVDLALAVHEREPSADEVAAITACLRRLQGLTLVVRSGDGLLVEPWLREALADLHGAEHDNRHERAALMCQRIIEADRASFETLTEGVHHLRAVGRFDELATFAQTLLPSLAGELSIAAFLGEVTLGFPVEHRAYLELAGAERDALEAVGSTAAAAAKGQELVDLLSSAGKNDTQVQLDLSAALDSQGRLARRLGQLDEARRHYERALAIDLRLRQEDPNDLRYQRNVGLSHQKIAQVAFDAADLDQARQAAQESLEIFQHLVETTPEQPILRRDLGVCLVTLAAVCRAYDTAEARHLLDQALVIWRDLVEETPDDADLQDHLFDAVSALSDLLGEAGDDGERFQQLTTEAASIVEKLAAAAPDTVAFQRKLLAAYWRLGDMDLGLGDLACAQQHFEGALTLAQRLADTDPDSIDGQRDLCAAYRRMADYAIANDQPQEVRGNLERSQEVAQDLVHRSPRNGGSHRDLAAACQNLGDWVRDTDDPAIARALFKQAMASSRRWATLDPEDLGAMLAQAALHDRLAELDRAVGHLGRARKHWQQALTIAQEVHAAIPTGEIQATVAHYEEQLS
ncbi:CHAT domain-containing protein [Micromonospora taraxaci]|uniref:CHAT domain-containing protein n=1 Tax=Micromonospora taraxaci TaxID=1316803 RepID=UPI0033C16957